MTEEYTEYNYIFGNVYFSDKETRYMMEDLHPNNVEILAKYIKDNLLTKDYSVRILYTNKTRAEWDKMLIYVRYKPNPKKISKSFIDEMCNKFVAIRPDIDFMVEEQFYVKFQTPHC